MSLAVRIVKQKTKWKKMADTFRTQIEEDISLIQHDWKHIDNNLRKPAYAFSYWVLSRLYSIEEELIPDLITEYNDKCIDCFVHYEESKELYIIQNKYYAEDTPLERGSVNDFIQAPLVSLNEGSYKKSADLQKLFNAIKDDPEYKIYLHFYLSNNLQNNDANSSIKNFNITPPIRIKALLLSEIKYLDDIKKLYYGEAFKDTVSFKYTLTTLYRGNQLRILPLDYSLPDMSKAIYMLTPVYQLFDMYKKSKKKNYALFEENIREYLGKNSINKGIINTLKDKTDRSNFFYYNNGITIISKKIDTPSKSSVELTQPQIVNGCQTVNSIYEVLNDYEDEQAKEVFKQTFVMVKILLFDAKTEEVKPNFYLDIVKYTNKQNSINETAFAAKTRVFASLQDEILKRGFLLTVKPSDKHILKTGFSSDAETNKLLSLANARSEKIGLKFKTLSELFIPLDKLLQVYLGFIKDGFFSYRKKDSLLRQSSEIYSNYSLKMSETLTTDNLLRLWLIYLKAEKNRSESEDKKTPIPYYLIGFLGRFIKNKDKLNQSVKELFESKPLFEKVFSYLEKLTNLYKKEYIKNTGNEYNLMIKRPIEDPILDEQIDRINDIMPDPELKKYFESLY